MDLHQAESLIRKRCPRCGGRHNKKIVSSGFIIKRYSVQCPACNSNWDEISLFKKETRERKKKDLKERKDRKEKQKIERLEKKRLASERARLELEYIKNTPFFYIHKSRKKIFNQIIIQYRKKPTNNCIKCAWSVFLDTNNDGFIKVTSKNLNSLLHCYYHDKWASPSPGAIKYWDPNDISKVDDSVTCNLWLSKNWKAELPKTENDRVIPTNVKRAVWVRDKGQCVQCGSNLNLEYDHIIPHSQGGSNTERNIQILCQDCNRKKSNNIV
jgi:hypothetical protein